MIEIEELSFQIDDKIFEKQIVRNYRKLHKATMSYCYMTNMAVPQMLRSLLAAVLCARLSPRRRTQHDRAGRTSKARLGSPNTHHFEAVEKTRFEEYQGGMTMGHPRSGGSGNTTHESIHAAPRSWASGTVSFVLQSTMWSSIMFVCSPSTCAATAWSSRVDASGWRVETARTKLVGGTSAF